jgi:hypothetical protein
MLQPTFTQPKSEKSMLGTLTGMCKLAIHPGVNELLHKGAKPWSHTGKHGPLQLTVDKITNINLPLTVRLAPVEKVDMMAMNVRSISLLANQILTEELGQSVERVVHARESGRLSHTVRGRVAERDVAHRLGCLRVNFISRLIRCIITKSLTEISIGAIALLRASHPGHVAVFIKVDSAVELANNIGIVVIFEHCNVQNTKLLHTLINKVKIILNMVVVVCHMECMLVHNPASLEMCLVTIMLIPHLPLSVSPKILVSSGIGSLLETVRITEVELPPPLNMHGAKAVIRNLLRHFRVGRSILGCRCLLNHWWVVRHPGSNNPPT